MDSEKLLFYEALLQQLQDDGFDDVIANLKQHVKVEPNGLLRKNHLFELFRNTAYLSSRVVSGVDSSDPEALAHSSESRILDVLNTVDNSGVILDPLFKITGFGKFCDFPTYRPCVTVTESYDGSLLATAGAGGALHIIPTVEANSDGMNRKPNWQVTTRLHGHQEDVEAIDFHPRRNIIASGSSSHSIIIHDINLSNGFINSASDIQHLPNNSKIRCLRFHPCGDFLYTGTDSSIVRLYDVTTGACFTSTQIRQQHQGGGVNDCDVLHSGGLFFTGGDDGSMLIWDGKTLDVLKSFDNIHGGTPVTSINCDKHDFYVVSSGQDGTTKVFDLRMMREMTSVGNANRPGAVRTISDFMLNSHYIATLSSIKSGRRATSEVHIYCIDTGSQEADISNVLGRSPITAMMASRHQMALYLLAEDASCKVVNIFDPSA
ncbi:cleavage stimulation factor subunit 1 [Babesia ovis]|uniref:Cleavage stimulation factor 50 kDa subunit n=1 Tax=Babesia ovis TaxID=5869 RepID=A0A9W5TBV8_BABOV|nr:cleavage stimulation factor subunit 1 [Babesia ovis]